MTTMIYEAPRLNFDQGTVDNEVLPIIGAILVAAGAALGVSAAFVAWVCSQCPGECRSLPQTIGTVRAWIDGSGC